MSTAALPTRLKLLDWGDSETTKGIIRVGPHTVRTLARNQAARGFDHIALDFAHNSLPGHPNFKPDPRKVAAYGVAEVVEGDGLYLAQIAYTPTGVEFAGEYPFLAPAPLLGPNREVEFLHSVALCSNAYADGPKLGTLSALVANACALASRSVREGIAKPAGFYAVENDLDSQVRRQLGISKEAWDRHARS